VYGVALRDQVRAWVLVEGHSQRSAAKQFGISRDSIARLLAEPAEGRDRRYRRESRPAPVREAVGAHIDRWLQENERLQRWAPKQRWTAHRMWVELGKLDVAVGESTVRALVRQRRATRKPAFVPLAFGPGERAEFDFGHAVIEVNDQRREVPFLAGRLRYSGAMFLECFPNERQTAFLLGQRHAFEFWGGVPHSAVYDNLKPAVARILQGHRRTEQDTFAHFRSVYLFEAIFANPHAGWEKGSVENLVGYARRTYLVPIPQVPSLEALNRWLRQQCLEDQQRTMAARERPIAELLEVERAQLGPLPAHPLEIGEVREVLVRSTGRMRFQTNEYSVPVRYAGSRLTLKADPFRVRLWAGNELVADHPRLYGQHQVAEDFRHYVPLLLEKPFAVPFASALRHGELSPSWEAFRQELVAHRAAAGAGDGNREFARVLELCLTYPVAQVTAALELAATSGRYSADAVRYLLEWAQEEGARSAAPVPLDPAAYPHYQLPQPRPDLAAYNRLLVPAAGAAGGEGPR
jgi:transposase